MKNDFEIENISVGLEEDMEHSYFDNAEDRIKYIKNNIKYLESLLKDEIIKEN